jgi:hypothetical protein
MPALSDPHNIFEVTRPPQVDQDQLFYLTFYPACLGPIVSFFISSYTSLTKLVYIKQLGSL